MTDEKITLYLTREEVRLLINSAHGTHQRMINEHGMDSTPIGDLMYRLADGSSDVYTE